MSGKTELQTEASATHGLSSTEGASLSDLLCVANGVRFMNCLKSLVDSYIKSEWINKRRELTYYKAREELLSGATIRSFEVCSTTPKPTFLDDYFTIANANPMVFDSYGEIKNIHIDGKTHVSVFSRDGLFLLSCNVENCELNT